VTNCLILNLKTYILVKENLVGITKLSSNCLNVKRWFSTICALSLVIHRLWSDIANLTYPSPVTKWRNILLKAWVISGGPWMTLFWTKAIEEWLWSYFSYSTCPLSWFVLWFLKGNSCTSCSIPFGKPTGLTNKPSSTILHFFYHNVSTSLHFPIIYWLWNSMKSLFIFHEIFPRHPVCLLK